jgi:tetratricopeptide (TPR) repeat protein
VLRNGLTEAAKDTAVSGLAEALKTVRQNKANALLAANKFDDAITYYNDLAKQDPNSSDIYMGLGNAYFNRAGKAEEAAKKADFKAAGDAYAKAYQLKPEDANLAFNAALAYQNCGELALAEGQWRAVLKKTPGDSDALSSLGSVLADEKKYDEATQVLLQAISIKPEEKVYFRQLGAVYSKAQNNPKTTEMLIVYMAMSKGTVAADPAASAKAAKAGSAAATTFGSLGAPDKVFEWDDQAGSGKLQTWLYTKKKQAYTYNTAGALVQKSDWSAGK